MYAYAALVHYARMLREERRVEISAALRRPRGKLFFTGEIASERNERLQKRHSTDACMDEKQLHNGKKER